MLTQCPYCATVFPIDTGQLLPADGRVRCGVCERDFDAFERLRRSAVADQAPPRLDPELAARQGDLFAPPVVSEEPPSFARPLPPPLPRQTAWWALAAVLGVLLVAQMAMAERDRWATAPAWRGAYEQLCARLGCSLPVWREPERLSLLSREIGPHPSAPNALLLTASIRNDAEWAQALPMLELSLSDLDGRVVGFRRFIPAEYHGDSDVRIAPGQTASLQLEIVDPGKDALAFAFEFR